MRITLENYKTADIDHIQITGEWDLPETKENRMHSIHAYPAKFPAFITDKTIRRAEAEGIEVNDVADVFCGCGTVSYETVRLGKHFWGCDINPVATLIARTKSQTYDDDTLHRLYDAILSEYEQVELDRNNEVYNNERIHYWFDDQHIDDLLRLKTSIINTVEEGKYRDFFLCAFSNILKSCSYWLTKSIKPQVDPKKQPKEVMIAFKEQMTKMLLANDENNIENDGLADIELANILNKEIEGPMADLVVTSPPYVTSYEYADLHQLSTLWLGYSDDYTAYREGSIGSKFHAAEFGENAKHLNEVAQDVVFKLYGKNKAQAKAAAQYYVDMQMVSQKVYDMLRPNGACLFVIGNTEYKGVKMDNARQLLEALLKTGFQNVEIGRRKISNKILSPYRDATGKFTTANPDSRRIYSEEFIVSARKLA